MEKLSEVFGVVPYEFYIFELLKTPEQLKKELLAELDNNENLLRLMYKFYKTIK